MQIVPIYGIKVMAQERKTLERWARWEQGYHLTIPQIIYTFLTTFAQYWWFCNGHPSPKDEKEYVSVIGFNQFNLIWGFKLKSFRQMTFDLLILYFIE